MALDMSSRSGPAWSHGAFLRRGALRQNVISKDRGWENRGARVPVEAGNATNPRPSPMIPMALLKTGA
jgi:hypothetical protein